MKNLNKFLMYVKNFGLSIAARKTMVYIFHKTHYVNYSQYINLSKKKRKTQENMIFLRKIKFSILVPSFDVSENILKAMFKSVRAQTYKDWEICHGKNLKEALNKAKGDFFVLLEPHDLLHPSALFYCVQAIDKGADLIYSDELVFLKKIRKVISTRFKPDFSPDTLRSYNYIGHLVAFSKTLATNMSGSNDYDIILRLTENAEKIVHIPKALYFWRKRPELVCPDAAKRAINSHLERIGLHGTVEDTDVLSVYKICYQIKNNPLISIIIPNYNHRDILEKCIDSIFRKTTYTNFEIIIVENNSTEKDIFIYYEYLKNKYHNICILCYDGEFNFSAINNFAFSYTKGEYILLLNNDTEVITSAWLEEMLMFVQREDVGGVGAKLYFPDWTIQHAGVLIGIGGLAGHAHHYFPKNSEGYNHRLVTVQNVSAVSGACLMTKRSIWQEMNGFDERYRVDFNDVDFCLRAGERGYNIIWTPFAELFHAESKTRGDKNTPEKKEQFRTEALLFQKRWAKFLTHGDPYYNVNLTLEWEDFSVKFFMESDMLPKR
jgi:GT2 family glycosyltransferase